MYKFIKISHDEWINIEAIVSFHIVFDDEIDRYYAVFRTNKTIYESYVFDNRKELEQWLIINKLL